MSESMVRCWVRNSMIAGLFLLALTALSGLVVTAVWSVQALSGAGHPVAAAGLGLVLLAVAIGALFTIYERQID